MNSARQHSPWVRTVAIIAAVALAGGSVVGVATLLFSDTGTPQQPSGQPTDGSANQGGGSPVTMQGSIPLEFAVVEDSTDGPCETGDNEGLQTRTQPVRCLTTGESFRVDRVDEATAFPIESNGAYVVTVSLFDDDAARLETFTGEHVGEEIAIVARSEALLAPRIDEPISEGMLTLTDPGLGRDGAVELARRFTG